MVYIPVIRKNCGFLHAKLLGTLLFPRVNSSTTLEAATSEPAGSLVEPYRALLHSCSLAVDPYFFLFFLTALSSQ